MGTSHELKKKRQSLYSRIIAPPFHSIPIPPSISQPPLQASKEKLSDFYFKRKYPLSFFLLIFFSTMDDESDQQPLSALRRRNSISTPVKLTLLAPNPLETATSFPNGNASSPPLDLELISLKTSLASYTSLKDILSSSPVAINSPTAGSATNSGYEISIRNRLVKQAAWAYLQPMSASPDSSGPHFFRRIWLRFSSQNPISSCLRFFHLTLLPGLIRVVDWILRIIGIQFTR
ncbi:hypothetical protein DITRI_Ditri12bG0127800 [Diplodiscus trichospermus]